MIIFFCVPLQQRIFDRIHNLDLSELAPKKFEVKKFMANTRLYVGNIANDVTDDEVKELFKPFGELDELFVNREKNFAFLKLVSTMFWCFERGCIN